MKRMTSIQILVIIYYEAMIIMREFYQILDKLFNNHVHYLERFELKMKATSERTI